MRAAVIASALCLSACGLDTVPDGPPNFQAGYQDGCYTGYAAAGMTLLFKFTRDVEAYDQDAIYRQGWDAGYQYCHSQQSVMNNMPAPDDDDVDRSRRNDTVTLPPSESPVALPSEVP